MSKQKRVQFDPSLIECFADKEQGAMVNKMHEQLMKLIGNSCHQWSEMHRALENLKFITSTGHGGMRNGIPPDHHDIIAASNIIRDARSRMDSCTTSIGMTLMFLRVFTDEELPEIEFTEYFNKNIKL